MIVYVYCFIVLLSRLRNFAVDTFIVKTMDIFCSRWEEIFQKNIVRKFPTRKFFRKFSKKLQANRRRQKFSRKKWRLRSRYWLVILYRWMSVSVIGPRANYFVCWGFFFLLIVHECPWSARKFACNSWVVLLSCCFLMYFFFFLFTNWGRHGGIIFKLIVFVLFVTLSSPPDPLQRGEGEGRERRNKISVWPALSRAG